MGSNNYTIGMGVGAGTFREYVVSMFQIVNHLHHGVAWYERAQNCISHFTSHSLIPHVPTPMAIEEVIYKSLQVTFTCSLLSVQVVTRAGFGQSVFRTCR